MGAVAPIPSSPIDIVDTAELDQLAEVIQLRSAVAVPEAAAAWDLLLPLAVGAKVETTLLSNEHWNNFWIGMGGRLTDAWNWTTHHLWGQPGVSQHQLQQSMQLSLHLGMRFSRQLFSKGFAKSMALGNMAVKGVSTVARQVLNLNHKVDLLRQDLLGRILRAIQAAERYTDQRLSRYAHDVNNRFSYERDLARRWVHQEVEQPLERRLHRLEDNLGKLGTTLEAKIRRDVHADLLAQLAPIALTVGHLAPQVAKLAKEAEECTEPMCETVGPKSDWGKLLKRFSPAAFWLLLAELAREDPHALETAAEDLASVLGPVLETWTMAWLGLSGGDRHEAERKAAQVIGRPPLGL